MVYINIYDVNVNKGDDVESDFIKYLIENIDPKNEEDKNILVPTDEETFFYFQTRKIPQEKREINKLFDFMEFIQIINIKQFIYSNIEKTYSGYEIQEEFLKKYNITKNITKKMIWNTSIEINRPDILKRCISVNNFNITREGRHLIFQCINYNSIESLQIIENTMTERQLWNHKQIPNIFSHAIYKNSFEFVKYLYENNYYTGLIGYYMEISAKNGNFKIIKYLQDKTNTPISNFVMNYAIQFNQIELVERLINGGYPVRLYMLRVARKYSNTTTVQYITNIVSNVFPNYEQYLVEINNSIILEEIQNGDNIFIQ